MNTTKHGRANVSITGATFAGKRIRVHETYAAYTVLRSESKTKNVENSDKRQYSYNSYVVFDIPIYLYILSLLCIGLPNVSLPPASDTGGV